MCPYKERYTETNVLHEEAKILKLKEGRHMHVLLHMFQLSQMPNYKIWKTHKTTGVRTWSSKKKLICSKRPNNEKYKRSKTYQGQKLWNLLPGYLQKIDSYYDLKTQVKKLFQFPKSRLKPKLKPNQNQNKIYCPVSPSSQTHFISSPSFSINSFLHF